MIAGGTSSREGVERREGREIERGDRRGPSAPCEIADELRPVCGFKRGPFACRDHAGVGKGGRSEEHTSELQSLLRISYAVFCLKKKKNKNKSASPSH